MYCGESAHRARKRRTRLDRYGLAFGPFVLAAQLGATAAGHAQTTNWIGTAGDWSNAANWDNGPPPFCSYLTSVNCTANVSNGGTSQVTSAQSTYALNIDGGSTVELRNGGNLNLGYLTLGDAATTGTLQFDGNSNLTVSGPVTINAGGATINANGSSATVIENITGSGSLTKTGSGTLTLIRQQYLCWRNNHCRRYISGRRSRSRKYALRRRCAYVRERNNIAGCFKSVAFKCGSSGRRGYDRYQWSGSNFIRPDLWPWRVDRVRRWNLCAYRHEYV